MTDRGPDGKFMPGSKGGPGRKTLEVNESVTALIDSVVTPKDWENIVDKLKTLALRGNLPAINALLDRRFGKPTERHEVGGKNGDALRIAIEYVNNPYPVASVSPATGGDTPEPKEI